MAPEQQDGLQWSAPTHIHAQRSADWYWALGILALCGTVAAVIWGDVLFAVIIALAAIVIFIVAARAPREFDIHISDDGVVIDREFYPFHSIRSFWIEEGHIPHPKLYLSTTGIIHPHLVIILQPPADPESIRTHLLQYVPEEEGHTMGTLFAHFLGF